MEEWRAVVGWEGLYEVPSLGHVRTLARHGRPTKILKPQYSSTGGYATVSLSRRSFGRTFKVHVMVATAFLGPRPAGLDVLHRNGDKTNCAASNLRYGTRSDNELDKVAHGTHQNARKTHCPHNHEYTPENTRIAKKANGRTQRVCKKCEAEARARRRV